MGKGSKSNYVKIEEGKRIRQRHEPSGPKRANFTEREQLLDSPEKVWLVKPPYTNKTGNYGTGANPMNKREEAALEGVHQEIQSMLSMNLFDMNKPQYKRHVAFIFRLYSEGYAPHGATRYVLKYRDFLEWYIIRYSPARHKYYDRSDKNCPFSQMQDANKGLAVEKSKLIAAFWKYFLPPPTRLSLMDRAERYAYTSDVRDFVKVRNKGVNKGTFHILTNKEPLNPPSKEEEIRHTDPLKYASIRRVDLKKLFTVKSNLNGNNGSATNTDDVDNASRQRRHKEAKNRVHQRPGQARGENNKNSCNKWRHEHECDGKCGFKHQIIRNFSVNCKNHKCAVCIPIKEQIRKDDEELKRADVAKKAERGELKDPRESLAGGAVDSRYAPQPPKDDVKKKRVTLPELASDSDSDDEAKFLDSSGGDDDVPGELPEDEPPNPPGEGEVLRISHVKLYFRGTQDCDCCDGPMGWLSRWIRGFFGDEVAPVRDFEIPINEIEEFKTVERPRLVQVQIQSRDGYNGYARVPIYPDLKDFLLKHASGWNWGDSTEAKQRQAINYQNDPKMGLAGDEPKYAHYDQTIWRFTALYVVQHSLRLQALAQATIVKPEHSIRTLN